MNASIKAQHELDNSAEVKAFNEAWTNACEAKKAGLVDFPPPIPAPAGYLKLCRVAKKLNTRERAALEVYKDSDLHKHGGACACSSMH